MPELFIQIQNISSCISAFILLGTNSFIPLLFLKTKIHNTTHRKALDKKGGKIKPFQIEKEGKMFYFILLHILTIIYEASEKLQSSLFLQPKHSVIVFASDEINDVKAISLKASNC